MIYIQANKSNLKLIKTHKMNIVEFKSSSCEQEV
jgi:hypothetical protein